MRISAIPLLSLALAPFLLGATPRVVFDRVLPAVHDLGSSRNIAVVKAPATPFVEQFLVEFLDHTNRSGLLEFVTGGATVRSPKSGSSWSRSSVRRRPTRSNAACATSTGTG